MTEPKPIGTYDNPHHGWTCFHCGETFKTPGAARDHFGGDPGAESGCLIRVKTGDERGLLMALRRAQDEIKSLRHEVEEADEERGALHQQRNQLERLFDGARNAYAAWLKFEAMESRALASEAIVAAAEEISPESIAKAREIVCGPEPKEAVA